MDDTLNNKSQDIYLVGHTPICQSHTNPSRTLSLLQLSKKRTKQQHLKVGEQEQRHRNITKSGRCMYIGVCVCVCVCVLYERERKREKRLKQKEKKRKRKQQLKDESHVHMP